MTSIAGCRILDRTLTFADRSKKSNSNNLKFKRAFQFLNLLLIQRVYGIDVTLYPSIRKPSKQSRNEQEEIQEQNYEVFLGGSCNPTTWRQEQAIPYFKSRSVSYYNPQVANWTPDLVEIEHRAKESAPLLFFVIDHDTRALASIVEVCYLAARRRNIIVVINPMMDKDHTKFVQQKPNNNESDDNEDYENVCEARRILRILLQSINIPVFDDLQLALECAVCKLERTKYDITHSAVPHENKQQDDAFRSPPLSPSDSYRSTTSPVIVIRSLSNKTAFSSTDDFYQQMHGFQQRQKQVQDNTKSVTVLERPTSLFTKAQTSCTTNESDDDGYGSLRSSNRALSISSSSLTSELFESAVEHPRADNHIISTKNSPTAMFQKLISPIYSYAPFTNFSNTSHSFISQKFMVLLKIPLRFIRSSLFRTNLALPSKFFSYKEQVNTNSLPLQALPGMSNFMFDVYIASGEDDEFWLNSYALPTLTKSNITYTKRHASSDNDQTDITDEILVRKRSRVLYYLINGRERLSHLAAELAFLIGERKHKIVVYFQSGIHDQSEHILSPCERRDVQRSRKYLEDLATKENIKLYDTREESWQQVLNFFQSQT